MGVRVLRTEPVLHIRTLPMRGTVCVCDFNTPEGSRVLQKIQPSGMCITYVCCCMALLPADTLLCQVLMHNLDTLCDDWCKRGKGLNYEYGEAEPVFGVCADQHCSDLCRQMAST